MNIKFELHELEPLILIQSIKDPVFFLKIKDFIKKEYFENEKLGFIFEKISVFFDKYKKIPQHKTLNTLFQKGLEDKAEDYLSLIDYIYKNEEQVDAEYVTDQSFDFIKKAKVIEAIKTSIPKIEEQKYGDIYDIIKKAVTIDFDKKLGTNFIEEAIEKAIEKNKPRISTGFASIDSVIGGGFEGGCLYTFSGTYGVGKSIWLQNVGIKLLMNGKNVLYYTLELSERAVIKRMISGYATITQNDFLDRIDDLKKQFKELQMITESNMWVKEYSANSASANTFRGHIEELKSTRNFIPDIVIVDYCNIMETIKKVSADNTYVRTKILFEELRSLAQETDIPIITASQINRGGLDEKKGGTKQLVTGANLSDSLGIGMTVDGHFIINQTSEEKEQGVMRLYFDKNRQGPDKMTKSFAINYNYLSITEDEDI